MPRCRRRPGSRCRSRATSPRWPRERRVRGAGQDRVDPDALLQQLQGVALHVDVDRLLAPRVAGLVGVGTDPRDRRVPVGRSGEVRLHLVEVLAPTEAGRRRDEPDRAPAPEKALLDGAVDEVAVAEEVDLLDAGGAVRHARTREQRVDRTAALVERGLDARLVAQVEVDRLGPGEGDGREVHHDHLGAEVLHELGDRRAHARRTSHDERALAVVPECISLHHVLLSSLRVPKPLARFDHAVPKRPTRQEATPSGSSSRATR